MSEIGLQNIKQDTIENLFKENSNFEVPFFQREYSWNKDEWIDFWEDAIKSKNNNSKHFFGFMTFRKIDEENIHIIEGQQRLTTIIILICLIRDIFYSWGDNYWQTLEKFIKKEDPFSPHEPASYKLVLSELNKIFFQKNIQDNDFPETKIDRLNELNNISLTNKCIFDCYKFLNNELNKSTKNLSKESKKEFYIELIKAIVRHFIIIRTEVDDNKAAFNIFQTLNDRGLDLTITDLLKIYLFGIVGESWKDAKDKWDDLRESLSQQNTNSFLRHYWLSKYSVIKEKELLSSIEKNIKKKNDVFKFIDELRDEAEYYDALLNPNKNFWGKKSQEIDSLLEELQILSKQQTIPLLMASCREDFFHTNEFVKLLQMMISYMFRYLTIGERENKELERLFSDIAIDIRKGNIKDTREIRSRLLNDYVDDDQFITLFSKKQIKSNKVARYILIKIENHVSEEAEKVNKRITLEHILPKSPNDEWKEYLKQQKMSKEEFVYRIGNLTLLSQKPNKDATNHFFTKKRDQIYKKETKLKINDSLKSLKSWNKEDIDKRQEDLAKLASQIWKI